MLGQAFRIAQYSGIPIRIHWTFGFFFIWLGYIGMRSGMDHRGILQLCLFAIVLFVCVVLHEFGHALTARRFGVDTKDIIISPIGGVARLLRMPKRPRHELIIALAGPAVNFVIAVILGIILTLFSSTGISPEVDPDRIFSNPQYFLPALFWLNIALIVFNLVPAFPMDGGRIFRALLSMKLSREQATQIATIMGQILAVGFIFFGLFRGDLILAFIGIFVFLSATNEYRMVRMESILDAGKVEDIYRSDFSPISIHDRMQKAIHLLEQGKETDLVIVDDFGMVKGVLHEEFIRHAMEKNDDQAPVLSYLSTSFEPVSLHLSLKSLLSLFQRKGYSVIPVLDTHDMIGVVDRKALNTYLRAQTSIWRNWRRFSKSALT